MSSKQYIRLLFQAFVYSLGWYLLILPAYLLYGLSILLAKWIDCNEISVIVTIFSIVQIYIFFVVLYGLTNEIIDYSKREFLQYKGKLDREVQLEKRKISIQKVELENGFKKEKRKLELDIQTERKKLADQNSKFEAKERMFRSIISSTNPFRVLSSMRTDLEMIIFDDSINYLKNKPHPAYTAADDIKRFKDISTKIKREAREIQYKYEYILKTFPEIREYVQEDQDLMEIGEAVSYASLEEIRDKRKDYLSRDEYNSLTETEKSKLALKRYLERPKTAWQIGRDYEMSCAFQLQNQGYQVELHGMKYGLKDLGRDLIAIRDFDGDFGGLFQDEILIIQCKNWNSKRVIHENVVMQLYGSTIMYSIEMGILSKQRIIPVLMIPPHSVISDVALEFAKKLNVRIWKMENRDYPRIKCNVNQGNKIYHLPFDQLYDRTEIKKDGEFYAWSIEEAESKGFRRAKRHLFNKTD